MNEWAEIRHIRYLLEIMKQGGVRAAAECLHTSPPNLCTQANQFQEHYHIRLYEKRPDNRIRLSNARCCCFVFSVALEQ